MCRVNLLEGRNARGPSRVKQRHPHLHGTASWFHATDSSTELDDGAVSGAETWKAVTLRRHL
jgi:hypothetical protein